MNIEIMKLNANTALAYGFQEVKGVSPAEVIQLIAELEGCRFAAAQHLQTVELQAAIIAGRTPCADPAIPAVEQALGVPSGWKLVPVAPTEDMMDATNLKIGGCYSCSASIPTWGECAEIYADMLAAAPTPPAAPTLTDAEIHKIALEIGMGTYGYEGDPCAYNLRFARDIEAHLAQKGGA